MDALSDALRSVRLKGGIFLDARFTAPWCVTSWVTPEDCRPYFESPAHIIGYHFIIDGDLLMGIIGKSQRPVHAGEIIIVPRNEPHVMGSAAGLTPVPSGHLIQPGANGAPNSVVMGGDGPETHMICGFLGTDDAYNPLFGALPGALHLNIRECASRDWVDASVRFAASELLAGRLASSSLLSRLSESLFVEAVRQYVATQEDGEQAWLRGLRDPHIGKALALIHSDITVSWSAEALAKEVAMSRSSFVDRFSSLVGQPPIRYLTNWRLQTARRLLQESPLTIAQLAHKVGYESEEAFSRAFKREFGLSPARWRDTEGTGEALAEAG
ncbi:MAG: AraC family transcriptional regulator [Bauldia sp.]